MKRYQKNNNDGNIISIRENDTQCEKENKAN